MRAQKLFLGLAMTDLIKFTSTFNKMIQMLKLPDSFNEPQPDKKTYLSEIEKDLSRTNYFSLKQPTSIIKERLRNTDNMAHYSYSQGNFDARGISIFPITAHPKFHMQLELAEKENKNFDMVLQTFATAYIDDDNQLCGLSITAVRNIGDKKKTFENRELFYNVTIIKNVTAEVDKRQVVFIGNQYYLDDHQIRAGTAVKSENIFAEITPIIKSKALSTLLIPLFNKYGAVSWNAMQELSSRITPGNLDNRDFIINQLQYFYNFSHKYLAKDQKLQDYLKQLTSDINTNINFFKEHKDNLIENIFLKVRQAIFRTEFNYSTDGLHFSNNLMHHLCDLEKQFLELKPTLSEKKQFQEQVKKLSAHILTAKPVTFNFCTKNDTTSNVLKNITHYINYYIIKEYGSKKLQSDFAIYLVSKYLPEEAEFVKYLRDEEDNVEFFTTNFPKKIQLIFLKIDDFLKLKENNEVIKTEIDRAELSEQLILLKNRIQLKITLLNKLDPIVIELNKLNEFFDEAMKNPATNIEEFQNISFSKLMALVDKKNEHILRVHQWAKNIYPDIPEIQEQVKKYLISILAHIDVLYSDQFTSNALKNSSTPKTYQGHSEEAINTDLNNLLINMETAINQTYRKVLIANQVKKILHQSNVRLSERVSSALIDEITVMPNLDINNKKEICSLILNKLKNETKSKQISIDREFTNARQKINPPPAMKNSFFTQRNTNYLSIGIGSLFFALGMAMLFTGILAPFGIILSGISYILGIVGTGMAVSSLFINAGLIIKQENKHQHEINAYNDTKAKYEQDLTNLNTRHQTALNKLDTDYNESIQVITNLSDNLDQAAHTDTINAQLSMGISTQYTPNREKLNKCNQNLTKATNLAASFFTSEYSDEKEEKIAANNNIQLVKPFEV